MELVIGPDILKSYKRLSYKVWYAFAEFIDNSTQSFVNYRKILEPVFNESSDFLTVSIKVDNKNDTISIEDNSIGMDLNDLERALALGIPPENKKGRSKYGLGMKTAAFWFGNTWSIKTKKYGTPYELEVKLDIDTIIEKIKQKSFQDERRNISLRRGEIFEEVPIQILDVVTKEVTGTIHGTCITINKLNQKITSRTIDKTKEYLRSIYRYDLQNDNLILFFDSDRLSWSKDEFKKRLLKDDTGIPYYKDFSFDINGKEVNGWAGVLEKGSRKDAGFSLLQSGRVIQGWPTSYRPTMLFGDQEGGINNLTNQRLIGELFLDDFNVSHTKDEILFEGDEEEELDQALHKKLIGLKRVAEAFRPTATEEVKIDFQPIVNEIFKNLQEKKFRSAIREYPVLSNKTIKLSNTEVYDRAVSEDLKDKYFTNISGVEVSIFINDLASVYDPYVVLRVRANPDSLGIVINRNHPHWQELTELNSVFQFIKECVLDGLAEWKALNMADSLLPETIKSIKDHYMRETFVIK